MERMGEAANLVSAEGETVPLAEEGKGVYLSERDFIRRGICAGEGIKRIKW